MGKIISVVNQKGGVAKTTTAINLSAALAKDKYGTESDNVKGEKGYKVLIIDLDPQGNATSGLGIDKKSLELTSYDVIMGDCRPAEAVVPTAYENLFIMPATQELAEAEVRLLVFEQQKTLQLRKAVLQIADDYDVIIIDSLPSLGILALNALAAADSVLIPMQCEPYSLEGVAELFANIKRVKKVNRTLDVLGIVFTMTDKRLTVNRDVMNSIRKNFPSDVIFKTEIPRSVKIAEAPSHGEPIIYYEPTGKGAQSYLKLAREVAKKL